MRKRGVWRRGGRTRLVLKEQDRWGRGGAGEAHTEAMCLTTGTGGSISKAYGGAKAGNPVPVAFVPRHQQAAPLALHRSTHDGRTLIGNVRARKRTGVPPSHKGHLPTNTNKAEVALEPLHHVCARPNSGEEPRAARSHLRLQHQHFRHVAGRPHPQHCQCPGHVAEALRAQLGRHLPARLVCSECAHMYVCVRVHMCAHMCVCVSARVCVLRTRETWLRESREHACTGSFALRSASVSVCTCALTMRVLRDATECHSHAA